MSKDPTVMPSGGQYVKSACAGLNASTAEIGARQLVSAWNPRTSRLCKEVRLSWQ